MSLDPKRCVVVGCWVVVFFSLNAARKRAVGIKPWNRNGVRCTKLLGSWHTRVHLSVRHSGKIKVSPEKQQGVGTACASPRSSSLPHALQPVNCAQQDFYQHRGVRRKCHFCALIDALPQTKATHQRQSLRKLKKDEKNQSA